MSLESHREPSQATTSTSVKGTRHFGPEQLTETPGTTLSLFEPKDVVAPDL